ncbi:MAG: large-conductance mechanosensitive channel protein MscL [Deltaproteobacteria bacterium]
MIKELKNFLMKGNVLDLAVAVIVAGAFGAIVTSFTQDIVMPPLGLLIGGIDFSDLKWVLKAAEGEIPEVAINYGKFLKFIVDFIIISTVLFYVVKAYNKATQAFKKEEEAAAPAGPSDNDLLKEIRDLLKK